MREPSGKTLPRGVLQLRFPYSVNNATEQYDADGNTKKIGADIDVTAMGYVLEFGITDKLSMQVGAPNFLKQEVTIDPTEFRTTAAYSAVFDAALEEHVKTYAAALVAQGVFPDAATASAAISSGTVSNPATGNPLIADLRSGVDSAIVSAASAAYEPGATGMGDLTVGFLYNFLNSGMIQSSFGLGVTLPQGKFKDVPDNQIPTGRGVTEAGAQFNLDILPFSALTLSYQITVGKMVAPGKKTVSEVDVDYEREGMRQYGFARAGLAFGAISRFLSPFGVYYAMNFDKDSKVVVDGIEATDASEFNSTAAGVRVDLLPIGVPVRLDFETVTPLSGKNDYAVTSKNAQVKLFFRF